MAKFCNRCGKQYADHLTQCPQCSGIEQQKGIPIYNKNTIEEKEKSSFMVIIGRMIFIIVIVLIVAKAMDIVPEDVLNIADNSFMSDEKIVENIKNEVDQSLENMEIVKIERMSDKKEDSDIHKVSVKIEAVGNAVRYVAEYRLKFSRSSSNNNGWFLYEGDIVNRTYSAKDLSLEEQVKGDLENEEIVQNKIREHAFSSVDCKSVKDVGASTIVEEGNQWENENNNRIRAECKATGNRTQGCSTIVYDLTACYWLDVFNDRWVLEDLSEKIVDYIWNIEGEWTCQEDTIYGTYDCWVKIYSMKEDYIVMEYQLNWDSNGEIENAKSDGKEKVPYQEGNMPMKGQVLMLQPKNFQRNLFICIGGEDFSGYPDGYIEYDEARLTR